MLLTPRWRARAGCCTPWGADWLDGDTALGVALAVEVLPDWHELRAPMLPFPVMHNSRDQECTIRGTSDAQFAGPVMHNSRDQECTIRGIRNADLRDMLCRNCVDLSV